jgi:5-methylcytosine-specific restriction endonuclease McrA
VDKALTYPDLMSQSLDHVVPLAEGGLHTYANTRIAHLTCNITRGRHGGGEQLALV